MDVAASIASSPGARSRDVLARAYARLDIVRAHLWHGACAPLFASRTLSAAGAATDVRVPSNNSAHDMGDSVSDGNGALGAWTGIRR